MNKNQLPITKSHFRRFLTAQPFFIWNDLENLSAEETVEEDPSFVWNEDYHAKLFSLNSMIQAQTFNKIEQALVNELTADLDPTSYVIISPKSDQATKLHLTKEAISENKLIIFPLFSYKEALARPFAYDAKFGVITNLKYATKLRRLDIAEGYYDYSVISAAHRVNQYELYLLDTEQSRSNYKRGQITFTRTEVPATSKSGTKLSDVLVNNRDGEVPEDFMSIFIQRQFKTKRSGEILLPDFDDALEKINAARLVVSPTNDLSLDVTPWGENAAWSDLLSAVKPEFANYSGLVLRKKDVVERDEVVEALSKSTLGSALLKAEGKLVISDSDEKHEAYYALEAAEHVVWYDFEGFSLPICALDYALPYQQIVFQVAVVKTTKGRVTEVLNNVHDPFSMQLEAFSAIIDAIYDEKASAYVVFNKSYELTRLAEMVEMLKAANHISYQESATKVAAIKAKTVDLYDEFRISSAKKLPPVLLTPERGKTSIKNVEHYLRTINFTSHVAVRDYSKLAIKNGFEAMEKAIIRALGISGEHEWNKYTAELKIYCENDVYMMLHVYEFLRFIINKK